MHTASTTALATILRNEVVHLEGVSRFAPCRRFASLFSDSSPSDSLYFLDSGLVKIFKRGEDGKEIILRIVAPGELFGEQALPGEEARRVRAGLRGSAAGGDHLRDSASGCFCRGCETRPQLWRLLAETLAARQRDLEKKVELLCLRDVEYRILYYLGELAALVGTRQRRSAGILDSAVAERVGQPDWGNARDHVHDVELAGSARAGAAGAAHSGGLFGRPFAQCGAAAEHARGR